LIAKFGDAEGDKPPTRNPNDVAVDPAGKLYVIDDTVGQNGVDTLTPPEIDARLAFYKAEVQRDGPTPPSSYPAKLIAGGAFPWPLFGFSGDGGQATAAQIAAAGIAVDAAGNVFFSEALDHRIRKVAAKTGIISTVVGTGKPGFSGDGGPGSAAQINAAITIAVDRAGNLFFSDNNRVRKVDATTGLVSTVAGNGRSEVSDDVAPRPASTACVGGQLSMALDSQEGLYFNAGYAVDRLDFKNGTVSRFAGTHEQGFAGDGGPATSAQLVGMLDWYACDPDDNLYISEGWSIRRVDARTHVITTPAGIINGKNASALVDGAPAKSVVLGGGFVVDRAGNIFICVGSDLWKVDAASGKMRLLAREFAGTGLAIDPEGDLFFAMTNQILELPADALSR
jgi:sugar lactone lactonase YvrE